MDGRSDATLAGAQAYAAVLARHTVAARMAAAEPAYPEGAAHAIGTVSEDQWARERFGGGHPMRPAAGPAILTYDGRTAGSFAVKPSGDGSRVYSFGATPEQVAAVVAGDAAVEAAARAEIARLTAERDALAKRVEALRAAIVSIRDQKQERVHHAWVTSIEALAADDKAAQS